MKETQTNHNADNAEETLKEIFSHEEPTETMHYVGITKEKTAN